MFAAFAAGLMEPSMRHSPPSTDAPDAVKVTLSSEELRSAMTAEPLTDAPFASGGAGMLMYRAMADAVIAGNIFGKSETRLKESQNPIANSAVATAIEGVQDSLGRRLGLNENLLPASIIGSNDDEEIFFDCFTKGGRKLTFSVLCAEGRCRMAAMVNGRVLGETTMNPV